MTYRAHFFSITATDPGHCSNPGRLARQGFESAAQPCPWTAEDAARIPSREFIAWAGLDFDTAEMDVELREALAKMAPEHGLLRALPQTARCTYAAQAYELDTAGSEVTEARVAMSSAMQDLVQVQAILLRINRNLTAARVALGLVTR